MPEERSIMAIGPDGGIAVAAPRSPHRNSVAHGAGGTYNTFNDMWHWTGRQPYYRDPLTGLMISDRAADWTPPDRDEMLAKFEPDVIVELAPSDLTTAELIREMEGTEQQVMVMAASKIVMLNQVSSELTAIFPDESRMKVDPTGRPDRSNQP